MGSTHQYNPVKMVMTILNMTCYTNKYLMFRYTQEQQIGQDIRMVMNRQKEVICLRQVENTKHQDNRTLN